MEFSRRLLFPVAIIIIIILYPLLCESHEWGKKWEGLLKANLLEEADN